MGKGDMTTAEFLKQQARARKQRGESPLEQKLRHQMWVSGLPTPEREYRFFPPRRWQFDFAWPDVKLACEVEGAVYAGGRHTRGEGFEKDCNKYNRALIEGWRVLRVTKSMIDNGVALELIRQALAARPCTIARARAEEE